MIRFVLFVLYLAFASAAPCPAAGGAAPAPDLEKTAALLDRWAARDRFPDSVSFAYYHVYSRTALGRPVPKEMADRLAAFVAKCQGPDGGFRSEPKYDPRSGVLETDFALRALDLLGRRDAVDAKKAAAFLAAMADDSGGLRPEPGAAPSLAATCRGVSALARLGALDRLDRKRTAAFIRRHEAAGGGFAMLPGKPASVRATDLAVSALAELGALTPEVRARAVKFLKGTRYSGLVKGKKFRGLPFLEAMAQELSALARLGALAEVDTASIRRFVHSLYVPYNGGFGPRPGYGTTPPATFHGLYCLVRLGDLPDPEAAARRR
ncbi:terpene cyclase/mutase family protein [Dissulfurirhabdus thermomarina]|uniref:Terpene cyclase/mutase family protein n=1 Tax=Dissulfurirhabdus thermomarina TaxID=1765737 RepID=A0A6N9TP26_DISTH|nr:prenyltransferase/squalene oxidase repeat-containing protein [Dissulfurirhabdus thermomarina]NDY41843.1 terpene cyclase/mutase family protein [Dissulfurirhabdus thermomarina]NMX22991.1 terpene cyclase/mutase family protein [Dissulfurirhabdus thermomarina]